MLLLEVGRFYIGGCEYFEIMSFSAELEWSSTELMEYQVWAFQGLQRHFFNCEFLILLS
jgi:hypothetical protein